MTTQKFFLLIFFPHFQSLNLLMLKEKEEKEVDSNPKLHKFLWKTKVLKKIAFKVFVEEKNFVNLLKLSFLFLDPSHEKSEDDQQNF